MGLGARESSGIKRLHSTPISRCCQLPDAGCRMHDTGCRMWKVSRVTPALGRGMCLPVIPQRQAWGRAGGSLAIIRASRTARTPCGKAASTPAAGPVPTDVAPVCDRSTPPKRAEPRMYALHCWLILFVASGRRNVLRPVRGRGVATIRALKAQPHGIAGLLLPHTCTLGGVSAILLQARNRYTHRGCHDL